MPLQWNFQPSQSALDWNGYSQDEDRETEVMWGGRPVAVSKLVDVAKRADTTPEAIAELGTPVGHLESRIASSWGGQTLLEAAEAFKNTGKTVAAEAGRVIFGDQYAQNIYADMNNRRAFLDFIERNGDVQALLGERGNRIYNGIVDMSTKVGTLGAAGVASQGGGVAANYSFIALDSWGRSLDAAQQQGLSGSESIGYAAAHSALATALAVGTGKLAQKAGVFTAEQSFSPAFLDQVHKNLAGKGAQSALGKAVRELGGWSAEGAQFALMEGGAQAVDIAFGLRDSIDYDAILDTAAMGVGMRAGRGAARGLENLHKRLEKKIPELAAGVRAAEVDMARGINPFEVKDIKNAQEFHKQTGRENTSKEFRDSYRDALDFYVTEARKRGEVGALEKLESDVRKLREEERQAKERAKQNTGRTGESTVKLEPVPENPIKTANERASYSAADMEAKIFGPRRPAEVEQTPIKVNPLLKAPWESETRLQRSLRVRTEQLNRTKEKFTEFRRTVAEQKKLHREQLDSLREIVVENVPAADRDRFFKRLVNATTPKRVEALLGAVDSYVDARDHKLAKLELRQAFRKAANLRTEFAQQVRDLQRSIDLRNFRGTEAAQKLQLLVTENPNIILSKQDRANLDRLGALSADKMRASDIRDMARHVEDLAYQSALKDRLIGYQESVALQDVADQISAEAVAAPSLAKVAEGYNAKTGAFGPVQSIPERSKFSLLRHEWSSRPEALLSTDPTLKRQLYDEVIAAEDRINFQFGELSRDFQQTLDSMGLTQDTSMTATLNKALGREQTTHDAWAEQQRQFGDVLLQRKQADLILWQLKDPQNLKDAWGTRITDEATGLKLPPLDSKLLTELVEFSGEQSLALIDKAFAIGNGQLIDRVNSAQEQLTGRPLTHRVDTVPRVIPSDSQYVQLLSAGRSADAFQSVLADSYSHLKHRAGGKYEMTLPTGMGFLDAFMTHSRRMLHFANMAVPARNAEMVLNHPDSKHAIQQRFGGQGYDELANAVKTQVTGFRPSGRGAAELKRWNSAVAGAHVTAKLKVMGSQFLDTIYAAAGEAGGSAHLLSGVRELATKNPRDAIAEMQEVLRRTSGEYWLRNESEDVATVQTYGQYTRQGYFQVPTFSQQMLRSLQQAELYLAQLPNYFAAKAKVREQFGLDPSDTNVYLDNPQWGKAIADSWRGKTLRGSTSSHALELSGALRFARNNPVAGLIMNFMNQTRTIAGVNTAAELAAGRGEYGRAVSMYGTLIGGGLAYALWSEVNSHHQREGDESLTVEVLKTALENQIGTIPIAGDLVNRGVIRPLIDRKSFGDDSVLMLDVAYTGLTGATQTALNISKWAFDQPNQRDVVKDLEKASILATFKGIPVPAIVDIVKRLYNKTVLPGVQPPESKPFKPRKLRLGQSL